MDLEVPRSSRGGGTIKLPDIDDFFPRLSQIKRAGDALPQTTRSFAASAHVDDQDRLVLKMRDAGLKPTRQRLQVARRLFVEGGRHVTAETLFAETRSERYPPSLATIYNALRDFAACGLLREVALYGSKLWYDTTVGPHFHYYLEQGEKLFDMPEEAQPALPVPAPPGMRITGVDVVVRLKRVSPAAATLRAHGKEC